MSAPKLESFNRSKMGKTKLVELLNHVGDTGPYVFRRARSHERPHGVDFPEAVFWKNQILAGLHFPPSPFFTSVSSFFRIPLNRISPASIRKATFFHMIMTMYGVNNTARLFFKSHSAKVRAGFVYFSPSFSAQFYGIYSSLDKSWQEDYFIVTPPLGVDWGDLAVPISVELESKNFFSGPDLTPTEQRLIVDVISALGSTHTLQRSLCNDLCALSFFDLRVNYPWTPDMGNPIVLCMFIAPLLFGACVYGA